jgi:hypothetical protein
MRLTADRVPPAIRGAAPSWWGDRLPPLAYGPFVAERANDVCQLGIALDYARQEEGADPLPPTGALAFDADDRRVTLVLKRDPFVANGKVHLRTTSGRVVLRPVRSSDRAWLMDDTGLPVRDQDLLAAIRRSFKW